MLRSYIFYGGEKMDDMDVIAESDVKDVVVEDDTTSSDDSGNRDQSTRFLKQFPTSERVL